MNENISSFNIFFFLSVRLLTDSIDGSCITGEKKEGYVPSDVNTLNTYHPHTEIYSLDECIDFCCRSDACDMAWMVDDSCYSVQCVTEETCQFRESPELEGVTVVVKITHPPGNHFL